MDFQLKQTQMENERRRLEREHEMNVLKLILSHQERPSTGPSHYVPNDNVSGFGHFYPGMSATPMYHSSIPMHPGLENMSVSDSDGSSYTTL